MFRARTTKSNPTAGACCIRMGQSCRLYLCFTTIRANTAGRIYGGCLRSTLPRSARRYSLCTLPSLQCEYFAHNRSWSRTQPTGRSRPWAMSKEPVDPPDQAHTLRSTCNGDGCDGRACT